MKCQNCGADLDDGVLFCRECGAKVETQKKYCRECGKEVPVDARFCSYCGADLSVIPVLDQPVSDEEAETPTSGNEETPVHTQLSRPSNDAEYSTAVTIWDKIAMKLQAFWSGLDNFSKVFTIASVIVVLLLLISFASHNAVAAFFSVLQIAGLVISMLWHKGVLNPPREWLKYITLAIAILFTVLNIMSYSWDKNKVVEESDKSAVSSSETDATNTIVSPPYNAADCLGQNYDTVKNDFISAGFTEIYTDAVEDLSYSESERIDTIESISIGGNDSFADGEQFSKSDKVEISYHAYKKVTVSIDVDFLSNIFFDKYGVVVCLNEEKVGELAHGEDKSFSLQVSPGTYTLTFQKKDDTSCVGSIELDVKGDVNASVQISCQSDNICVTPLYIEKIGEVREGEIMMPQALSSFKYKNYLDVQNTLENLGFTNISTEILYDIHWGWTAEGEVESVSIDGNADCVRGDIFSADSPIIITYHMKEEDDPSRATAATEPSTATESTEATASKAYSIDKDLVVTKCERDAKYTTMYNIAFAEIDSSGKHLCEYSFGHCINPRTMGKQFNATGDLPSWFYVGATVHVKANYSYDELKDTTVTEAVGANSVESESSTETKSTIVLPESSSKLGKDYDFESSSTVYYINVDGIKNKPLIQQWNGATVTDGVAEYLELLNSKGFDVRITNQSSNTPYAGFTYYETYFEVSDSELTWTMYLNIQSENYVEYEFDINLD